MSKFTDALQHLNPSQRQAVEHVNGPLLVVAGAGSGKTRALTFRIANLILTHRVDPENILAVTFTNKAAKEMKHRVEQLFAEQESQREYGKPFAALKEYEQTKLRSRIYKTITKDLWIGTFHSLCCRILRFDIEKYQDEHGRKWTKTFSIFDESDVQSVIKDIIINKLNLDEKKFEPRNIRYAISNAKNKAQSPAEVEKDQPNYRGRVIADVYRHYLDRMVENNALDFDDLILMPVKLLQQNEQVRNYWHQRFRHLLVDEYQDTNRTQYDFLQLIATNGRDPKRFEEWDQRSIFVVGDADQCLPPGSKVTTVTGEKSIESLKVGDEIMATAGYGELQTSKIATVKEGYYRGPMWCVKVGDRVLRGTPHHILPGRMVPLEEVHYVYLMYRADRGYRIGITKGLRKNDYGKEATGFSVRINQEGGDKLWVLKSVTSYEEARYYEAYFSTKFGLPTVLFHGNGRELKMGEEWIFKIFQEIDTITNAQVLMQHLCLHPDYPHYRPQNGSRRQTLNLVMFGHQRKDRIVPKGDHRLQWSSNRPEIADKLTAAGFPVRAGKLPGTYRYETARADYREAVQIAHMVADTGTLEIRRRAMIHGEVYELMPLSHLHPKMRVLIQTNGQVEEAEVTEVWQEDYDGPVYDLEIEQHHNYIANDVLVHNSIYSFRSADFTILMGFQKDFGDGLKDDETRSMVKLEENYRSTSNILQLANTLIENNTERIDKILKATRGEGEPTFCYRASDEIDEAEFVVRQTQMLERNNPDLEFGNFAILYRTNAQSRALEESLVRAQLPYRVVGGLRFYDRREIKDVLGYLRAVANPSDAVSLLRVINTPKRGVGKSTVESLVRASTELGVPLWEILIDETSVKTLAGRSSKGVLEFVKILQKYRQQLSNVSASELVQGILEDSGYLSALKAEGTEEAENRFENVQELYNAVLQFEEDNSAEDDDRSLTGFLASAALASDLEDSNTDDNRISLMTLHASKGLEFPVVFLVGLEQGLFPSFRSLDDPAAVEEERRLCYVGITRAQERLFISHARERRLYGNREIAYPSLFLEEMPEELLQSNAKRMGVKKGSPSDAPPARAKVPAKKAQPARAASGGGGDLTWAVGDRAVHDGWGVGTVTHVFQTGSKLHLAVKFPSMGQKIIDPRLVPLRKVE
jgi:DNA helicase II / ATP-dependent DNA helicase PcrA